MRMPYNVIPFTKNLRYREGFKQAFKSIHIQVVKGINHLHTLCTIKSRFDFDDAFEIQAFIFQYNVV